MLSKQAITSLLMILLCMLFIPRAGHAADWTVSPYRAQLASGPGDPPESGNIPERPL
jgi:hypothetical protein